MVSCVFVVSLNLLLLLHLRSNHEITRNDTKKAKKSYSSKTDFIGRPEFNVKYLSRSATLSLSHRIFRLARKL